jgi:DnaJ-class molecular chaperone
MTTQRDYYEILGLTKGASSTEIKAAYRKKALEYHPDRNRSHDAEQKFKEVNEAYQVLSDAQKKQAYDQFGHVAFDPRSGGFGGFSNMGQTGRSGPFTYTYYSGGGNPFGNMGGVDFSDPFDIFEQFFGGASPFGQRHQAKPHYSLRVPFMEAIEGAERTIVHQGKEHAIKIPPGASDGTRIRYNDFDVSINVLPHETFRRDGDDIFVDVPVPLSMASLGGEIEVPTVDGEVKMKVRSGTQPATMIRLQGRGVPHLRGRGRGDHYIRLIVTVPKDMNREQRRLMQKLSESGL